MNRCRTVSVIQIEVSSFFASHGVSANLFCILAAPPQENFPESLAGSAPSGSSLPGSSADSSNQTSRWDELRRSRANPPSSWDLLRESSNKQESSSGTSPDGREENASQKESRLDREKRKKEFEALFDQEAKGGDDNMGDKVWR